MIVHCLVRILGPLVRHSSQVPTLISIPLGLLQRSVRGTKAPSNYVVRSRPKPSFLARAPDDKLPIAAEDSVGRRDKMSRITNLVLKLKVWKDTRGQDLIEYALMAAFVAEPSGVLAYAGLARARPTIHRLPLAVA